MTIAGFLPARAKYFWAEKSANVSGFLYTTLQSKCSLGAQERQAEKRFSYLRKWLIAASRQGRGNFTSSAAKCRRRCSKAFPPRSFASKLCPHSGPATASHRPSNKIVPGNATLLQTSSLSAVFTRGVVSNPPTHARDPARPVFLPQATQPEPPHASATGHLRAPRLSPPSIPTTPLRDGLRAINDAAVTTLIKYTPWNLT